MQKFGAILDEEVRKSAMCHAVVETPSLIDYEKFSNYDKLHRVFAYVFLFLDKVQKKNRPASDSAATLLLPVHFELAEQFLVRDAQKSLDPSKYESLQPRTLKYEDARGQQRRSIVISGRLGQHLRIGYDKTDLPLIEYKSPLARLIMLKAHNAAHSGLDKTVQRSRNHVWIVRGSQLAKTIRYNCFCCKIRDFIQ